MLKLQQKPGSVAAAWWNDSWSFRQRLDITNAGVGQTNVYITLTIGTSDPTRFKANCGDIRFTDNSSVPLAYYIVSGCGTASTVIHINFSTLPAGQSTAYLYYGNPSAVNGFSATDFSTAASSTTPTPAAEEVGAAPVAWYKLDEGANTTANDSASKKNNGALAAGASSPVWQAESSCVVGKCLWFYGNGSTYSYVSIPDKDGFNDFDYNQNFTVSFWVRGSTNAFSNSIVEKWDGGGGYSYVFRYATGNNSLTFARYDGTNNPSVTGTKVINDNQWHYITGFKNSSLLYLYVDGSLQSSAVDTTVSSVLNSSALYLGTRGGSPSRSYTGFIDDVKLFSYARTPLQIQQDYLSGLTSLSSAKGAEVDIGGNTTNLSLQNGLLGYWKFDEGNGTSTVDSSGNGNLAAFGPGSSAPGWSGGKYNIGLSFDGNASYLQIPVGSSSPTTAFTASAWVNPLTPYTGFGGIFGDFNNGGFKIYTNAGGNLTVGFRNNPGTIVSCAAGSTLPPGVWTFTTVTYNTGNLNIYLNGALSVGCTGDVALPAMLNHYVGRNPDNSATFNGSIDEVRYYNRALSASEVTALYNYAPGPVGYWNFDDGFGSIVQDRSGLGNTGTWAGTLGNQWINGKYGKAGNFNGTDNSVYLPNPSTLKIANQITLSAWIKAAANTPDYSGIVESRDGAGVITGLEISSNSALRLDYYGATTFTNLIGTKNLRDNQWHYVAATYDGSTLKIFADGNPDGTSTVALGNVNTSDFFKVGWDDISAGRYFHGVIDDVKIYNYARTQKQIIQDMAGGTPNVSSRTPVAYWKFNEGAGTLTNNSGTYGIGLSAAFGLGTSSPSWASDSQSGKSLLFSPFQYLAYTPYFLENVTQITISAWIKPSSDMNIFQYSCSSGYNGFINYFRVSAAGALFTDIEDAVTTAHFSPNTGIGLVPMNQWSYVAETIDLNYVRFYVNGRLVYTSAYFNGLYPLHNANPNYNNIGRENYNGGATINGSTGLLDELKIYPYALSASDILTDYNRSSSVTFSPSTQTIGATTTSLDYCLPGDTTYCAPPVAEYKFEEGTGTTAYDSSGNNNHAVLINSPVWTNSKFGKGLLLNGNNSYIDAGTGPNNFISTTGTLGLWFKATTAFSGAQAQRQSLMGGGPRELYFSSSSSKLFYFLPDDATGVSSTGGSWDTNWHYVAVISNGTTLSMYLDGLFQSSVATGGQNFFANLSDLTVGSASTSFNGKIDQLRLYNYARTPAQIALDYNKGGPVGWWKFNECQGSVAYDSSGIGNTGSISIGASGTQNSLGTCSVGTSAAWTNGASGHSGGSLNLDGSDDYVTVSSGPYNTFGTSNFTVSSWVKTSASGSQSCIASIAGGSLGFRFGFTGGKPYYLYGDGTHYHEGSIGNVNINDNKWHLITNVYYYANQVTSYVDGAYVGSASVSDVTGSITTNNKMWIGQMNGALNGTVTGQIDDVRLYNYALTPSQIAQLYNGGAVSF